MNTTNNTAPVVQVYACSLCNLHCSEERDADHALARMCECCHGLAETDEHLTRTHGASIAADADDILDYVAKIIVQGGTVHPLAQRLFALASAIKWAMRSRLTPRVVFAPAHATEREAALHASLASAQYQLGELLCDIPEECTAAREHVLREIEHIGATLNAGKAVRS
jgi:hypothetical protein